MELTSLLGYGASERSLLLMWRLGLLDMLLPQHALYLRVRTNARQYHPMACRCTACLTVGYWLHEMVWWYAAWCLLSQLH